MIEGEGREAGKGGGEEGKRRDKENLNPAQPTASQLSSQPSPNPQPNAYPQEERVMKIREEGKGGQKKCTPKLRNEREEAHFSSAVAL